MSATGEKEKHVKTPEKTEAESGKTPEKNNNKIDISEDDVSVS